mgnify:CR=1 FL=1
MSVNFFRDTWNRAERIRQQPLFGLTRALLPSVPNCPSYPIISNCHPALLAERYLLSLSDEQFAQARPTHLNKLKANTAARTGVAWIDEAERKLFGG